MHRLSSQTAKRSPTRGICSGLAHGQEREMQHGSFVYITTFGGTGYVPFLNYFNLVDGVDNNTAHRRSQVS